MGREIRYGLASAIQDGSITGAKLADGSITNAKVSASAAIDSTKLNADTLGTITATPSQDIAQYETVGYGDGTTSSIVSQLSGASDNDFGDIVGNMEYAMKITGASVNDFVSTITLKLKKSGTPTDNMTVTVRSGSETGTILATGSVPGTTLTTTATDYDIALSTPVTFVSGTNYYIIVSRDTALNAANYYWVRISGTDVFASGNMSYNNNGTWNATAWDMYFILKKTYSTSGLYKGSVSTAALANKIIGLAKNAITSGVAGEIQVDGVVTNVAWNWTPGVVLYASNTLGALSETAGANSRPVGRALSATKVKIDFA